VTDPITTLCSVGQTSSSISSFFDTSRCYSILQEVADAELNAADDLLHRLSEFTNKKDALNRVLSHLESAHQLHRKSWANFDKNVIGNTVNEIDGFIHARYKDAFVCCSIAIVHRYLGESKDTINYYLELAEDAVTARVVNDRIRNMSGWEKTGFVASGATAIVVSPFGRMPIFLKHVSKGAEHLRKHRLMREFIRNEKKDPKTIRALKRSLLG